MSRAIQLAKAHWLRRQAYDGRKEGDAKCMMQVLMQMWRTGNVGHSRKGLAVTVIQNKRRATKMALKFEK